MKSPSEPWGCADWIVALVAIGIMVLGGYSVYRLTGNPWAGVLAWFCAWVLLSMARTVRRS